jgi:hypothetical protein
MAFAAGNAVLSASRLCQGLLNKESSAAQGQL